MANRKLQYPSVSKVIQIPPASPVTPPGGYFSKFDLVQLPKPQQQRSFITNVIKVPTPYPVVPGGNFFDFGIPVRPKFVQVGFVNTLQLPVAPVVQNYVFTAFDQPRAIKTPYPNFDDGWIGLQVAQNFVFSQFTQPQAVKPQQVDSIQFGITQLPPVVITAGGFQDWDPPFKSKGIQEGVITSTTLPIVTVVQPYVFSQFDQPRPKSIQIDDAGNSVSTPPVVTLTPANFTGFLDFGIASTTTKSIQDTAFDGYAQIPPIAPSGAVISFSDFSFHLRKKLFYQAGGFIPPVIAAPAPVIFSGFSNFDIPRISRAAFQDVSNAPQLQTAIQPYVFSPFDNLQPSSRVFHQAGHFVLIQQPAVVVQPYIFSSFEQPQFKKLFLDTGVQFELLSIANPVPPVFTGFSDFGTAQQLIGTQRRQDGSSVDFRVLQPVFVPSVVQFGGWYDFGVRPNPILFKAFEQPQVVYEILVPPIPLESAFAGKRWKYQETKKTPEKKEPKNKVLPLKSSNLAAMSYDEDKKELRLTFKTYKYENVSKKKVQNLSHGEYFQKHIKAKHPTAKV